MPTIVISQEMADLFDREFAAIERAQLREDERMLRALRGGPYYTAGKAPVKAGDVRGIAEFLPRPRRG